MTAKKGSIETELDEFLIIDLNDQENTTYQCIMYYSKELYDYLNNLFQTHSIFEDIDFEMSGPLLMHKDSINYVMTKILRNYEEGLYQSGVYVKTYFIDKKLEIEKIQKLLENTENNIWWENFFIKIKQNT